MTALLLDTELTNEQREYVEATRTRRGRNAPASSTTFLGFFRRSSPAKLPELKATLSSCIPASRKALDLLDSAQAGGKHLDLAYLIEEGIPRKDSSSATSGRLRQILVEPGRQRH